MPEKRILFSVLIFFFALTLSVYGVSLQHGFVRWDDGLLITENPAVQEISAGSLAWVFTHFDPELYIPLTFVSYQIDHLIGGGSPMLFHLTNLLLHTLNAFLVFLFIFFLTGRRWVALFCGLLFAVHPLHTEAVAWASARKDVLSSVFFLASLCSFLYYRTTGRQNNRTTIALFFLALMSKVSVIALPLILILIDYYQGRSLKEKQIWKEKIPYFALSVVFGCIALFGKQAVISETTLWQTILMACRSAIFGLQKLFLPTELSVLYPAEHVPTLAYPEYLLPLLIALVLVGSLYLLRRCRTLVFGALFFLLMTAPNFLNLAKDGDWYVASDRYFYLASIGVLIIVMQFLRSIVTSYRLQVTSFLGVSVVVVVLGMMSFTQSRVWANSEALFANVTTHYPHSHRALNNLGNVHRRNEEYEEAIGMFERALAVSPRPKTYSNLGALYRKMGRMKEAMEQYRTTIDMFPDDPEPYFGLGLVYAERGDFENARSSYLSAIDRDPLYAEAHSNLGALYAAVGEYEKAIESYKEAIQANPHFVEASFNLGVALTKMGRIDEAIRTYRSTLRLRPDIIAARINLGLLLYNTGDVAGAVQEFKAVLVRDPGNRVAEAALAQIGGEY